MTKKILLISIFLFFGIVVSYAQSYQWIKGGGSTEAMSPYNNMEKVTNMCTDANGNVYLTAVVGATSILADTFFKALAFNTFASRPHIMLASYTCSGTMRWAKLIESSSSAKAGGIAYSNGSLYLVGTLIGNNKHIGYDTTITSTYLHSFTARFDTGGSFKWIRFIGTDIALTGSNTGAQGALAIDGLGYIHNFNLMGSGVEITPLITSTIGTWDLKYDTTGNLLTANRIPSLDSIWMISKAIFNLETGKFYALQELNPMYPYISSRFVLSCFRPDETLVWKDTTSPGCAVSSLDFRGGNELYISGQGNYPDTFSFGGLTVTDTIFPTYNIAVVCRLDTNGVARWIYNLQTNSSIANFSDLTILPGGKVAAAGIILGTGIHGTDTINSTTGEFRNPMLAIIDSSGNTIKLDQLHGPGNDDAGTFITSDIVGNIYEGGMVSSTMAATGITPYNSHGGNTDFFILKYGVDCSCTAAPIANYTATGTTTISVTYTGTTAGLDSVVWDFGDGGRATGLTAAHTYSSAGTYLVCATVYTDCGSDRHCTSITVTGPPTGIAVLNAQHNIHVYPNPTKNELNITGIAGPATYTLHNIAGATMLIGELNQPTGTISVKTLPPGVYVLSIISANGQRDVVRVVVE